MTNIKYDETNDWDLFQNDERKKTDWDKRTPQDMAKEEKREELIKTLVELCRVDTWDGVNKHSVRSIFESYADRIIKLFENGQLSNKSELKKEAVREFVDWLMGIEVGENLGMGSLDYHEKCAIDGFKEYVRFNFIEGDYLSSDEKNSEEK